MKFTEKQTRLIDFSICYVLSNSDDEAVSELLEHLTGHDQFNNDDHWVDFVEGVQKALNAEDLTDADTCGGSGCIYCITEEGHDELCGHDPKTVIRNSYGPICSKLTLIAAPSTAEIVKAFNDKPQPDDCEVCSGVGYTLIFNTDTDVDEIQKCDDCGIYKTDEDALSACYKLSQQAVTLLATLMDQQFDLNLAILGTPTGEIRDKLTEINIKRGVAVSAATN